MIRSKKIVLLAVSVWLNGFAALATAAEKPNFVLILADDLGYGDLGSYGSKVHETPHLDRMAAGGIRFTDFHANGPMCSPTRAALLTGMYQQRFGRKFDSALSGVEHRDTGLPLDVTTIAEVLKKEGYATGAFGKWHLGFTPPFWPTRQGFDEFWGLGSGDGDFHTHIDRSGNEDWWHNEQIRMEKGYTTDLLTKHSIDFIERHKDRPFFVYLPHLAIHFPWQGPDDPPHRFAGQDWSQDKWGIIPDRSNVAPHVKAMVESLDDSVGRVLEALRKNGLLENTLVIFTSDNGGYINYPGGFENISSNGPLKGQKGGVEEGGHRVPAVFYWEGKIQAGRVSAETVTTMDIFPTLLRLAGATPPGNQKLDGVDLASHLIEGRSLADRLLFWRRGEQRAVRDGVWKWMMFDQKEPELYNLEEDIGESVNLAGKHRKKVEALKEAWFAWDEDVNGGFR